MNQDQIDSLVRSLLKVVGGILAAHGLTATAGIVNSTNVTELVSGIVVTLIGFYASHTSAATQPVDTTAVVVTPTTTVTKIATPTATTPLTVVPMTTPVSVSPVVGLPTVSSTTNP